MASLEESRKNCQELLDFVNVHELRDRFSIIRFNAIVNITTVKNRIVNKPIEVMISFDNYNSFGDITFMENELDPYLYPTTFEAKWQTMEHIDNEYLLISDVHRKNPDIGKYVVKILPLKRLRD